MVRRCHVLGLNRSTDNIFGALYTIYGALAAATTITNQASRMLKLKQSLLPCLSLPPPPLPLPQDGVWLLQSGAAHGEPVWGVRAQAGLRCGQPTGQGVALLGGRRRVPGHTLHDKQGEAGWNGRPGGGGGRVGRAKGLTEQSARCICSARVRFKAVELCR